MDLSAFLSNVNAYILNPLILLAFAVSTVYFFYGIVKFLAKGSEVVDKSREEAQKAILWGLVGMIVMFSVFGLIRFVLDTFGINSSDPSLQNIKQYINYK